MVIIYLCLHHQVDFVVDTALMLMFFVLLSNSESLSYYQI